MRIVVVGATSEIAQQCCRIWLESDQVSLVLAGRNMEKLSRIANDFRIRFPSSRIELQAFDHNSVTSIEEFAIEMSQKPIDIVLVAHGSLTSQPIANRAPEYLWQEHKTNALSPILFAELFAGVLARQGFGSLAVIGSVAGDRGRAINHAYGAAKAALATYVSGLQQRLANSPVRVSLIKPGPTKTPMTFDAHVGPSKLAEPKLVARQIVEGIASGRRIIYSPKYWRAIMFIVRFLPFTIFRLLRF